MTKRTAFVLSLFMTGILAWAQVALAASNPRALNPQPLPPGMKVALNPQPLPPGAQAASGKNQVNPQPLPPGSGKTVKSSTK